MEVTTIGIDLAKSVFAVSGADRRGRVIVRRQLRRAQVLGFMRGLPRCTVGMFILQNLPAIAEPLHSDRKLVDLLFFPTGGGKTEACSAR